MSTSEGKVETCVTTNATANDVLAAIQSNAKALLVEICDYDRETVQPLLGQLRDTLEQAHRQGVPEADIARTLEEVRQSGPEVIGTWDEILDQVTVYVWLEDPDGNRVRGDTVVVDLICWEYDDAEDLLDDTVQQLREDLEVDWEVVSQS